MAKLIDAAKRRWARISARPGVAHLIRAWERTTDRLASHFAAAITYFSFLSLVPIVMVAFSIAGLVLASQPAVLNGLKEEVTSLVPGDGLGTSIGELIDNAVGQSLTVGIIGLVIALYSGLSWMGNVRDAVRAQWRPQWRKPKQSARAVLMQYVWDLASLGGLFVGVVVSFALTAIGTAAQSWVVGLLGISDSGFLSTVLKIGPFALAIIANSLIFAWMYTMLPQRRYRANRRTLVIGSLVMGVIFEILKAALALLVARTGHSPTGAFFGSIIGLLLFFNLVARAFLMTAAWMATAVGEAAAQEADGLDEAEAREDSSEEGGRALPDVDRSTAPKAAT